MWQPHAFDTCLISSTFPGHVRQTGRKMPQISLRTPLTSKIFLVSCLKFNHLHLPFLQRRAMAEAVNNKVGAHDKPSETGALSRDILPYLFNLYSCKPTARDFEIYSPNATFEDPFMRADGIKQIKSAFYSLPKTVREGKIVEYSVQENETSHGCGEILIDSKQHYNVLGKSIDLTSIIALQVEHGKIIRHEDRWDKKPLKNRHTISFPLVGRMVEGMRKFSMLITHAMMGFGKDPRA